MQIYKSGISYPQYFAKKRHKIYIGYFRGYRYGGKNSEVILRTLAKKLMQREHLNIYRFDPSCFQDIHEAKNTII